MPMPTRLRLAAIISLQSNRYASPIGIIFNNRHNEIRRNRRRHFRNLHASFAGHYLVNGGFRYEDAPDYKRDESFVDNYNNTTGDAEFEYAGCNDRDEPYAFYGMHPLTCGDIPVTENDETNGDLYIKYVSEPTPDECQDIILQTQFTVGTGTIDWKQSSACMVLNHGIC